MKKIIFGKTIKIILTLDKLLRSCLQCGKSWGFIDLYCSDCWEHVEEITKSKEKIPFERHQLKVLSLFEWKNHEDGEIKKLIYSLKGGGPVFDSLGQLFVQNIYLEIPNIINKRILIVPAPPKSRNERDHAYMLAKVIGEGLRGELYCGLERGIDKSQKSLNREARREVRVINRGHIRHEKYDQIVFVDDVITTGSTARAVQKALGNPPHFQVWALASCPVAINAK